MVLSCKEFSQIKTFEMLKCRQREKERQTIRPSERALFLQREAVQRLELFFLSKAEQFLGG